MVALRGPHGHRNLQEENSQMIFGSSVTSAHMGTPAIGNPCATGHIFDRMARALPRQ